MRRSRIRTERRSARDSTGFKRNGDTAMRERERLLLQEQQERDAMAAERSRVKEEIKTLKEEAVRWKSMHTHLVARHAGETKTLRAEIKPLRNENSVLKEQLLVVNEETIKLRADIQAATSAQEAYRRLITSMRADMKNAARVYTKSRDTTIAAHQRREAAYRAQIGDLEARVALAAQDYMAIAASESCLKAEVAKLRRDRTVQQQELDMIRVLEVEAADGDDPEVAALRLKIDRLKKQISSMESSSPSASA